MAKKKKEPAPKPTIAELAEYFAREEERKKLARQSKDLKALNDATEAKCLAYVQENGGKAKLCIIGGYRLWIHLKNAAIQWKTIVLQKLGEEAVEEATKAAEKIEALEIEPPSAAA